MICQMATHSRILVWRICMDRGAWQATVYRIAKGRIRLKWLSMHMSSHLILEVALWGRCCYACFYTGRNWCSKKVNVLPKVKELVSNRPKCLRSRGLFLVTMKSPISSHVDWSWISTQACKSTPSSLGWGVVLGVIGNLTSHPDSVHYKHRGPRQIAFPLEACMPSMTNRLPGAM